VRIAVPEGESALPAWWASTISKHAEPGRGGELLAQPREAVGVPARGADDDRRRAPDRGLDDGLRDLREREVDRHVGARELVERIVRADEGVHREVVRLLDEAGREAPHAAGGAHDGDGADHAPQTSRG